MILSKQLLQAEITTPAELPAPAQFNLPEKVLQFGTGVLLRGLPDYFIDKANKNGLFNGRIVMVKSTATGDTSAYEQQDHLYTLLERGIENGTQVDSATVNASVSKVINASTDWHQVLEYAASPEMQVIISNTTEVGIVYRQENIFTMPPVSFPAKLLSFLYHRYRSFDGAMNAGMVIIPTELVTDNGDKLKAILLQLTADHKMEQVFVNWLTEANHFCNSLVDRIVPGSLPADQQSSIENLLGYKDQLMIMCEPYRLWAIESSNVRVKELLSFHLADEQVIIVPDINLYRVLKLRLLNGSHSFACGLALLCGFVTVKEAMQHPGFFDYLKKLMDIEIIPSITSDVISPDIAQSFSIQVLDRFCNPFIDHRWLAISTQYSSKMAMRCVPLIVEYIKRYAARPNYMALGFAAYLLFMKPGAKRDGKYYGCIAGNEYLLNDDHADKVAQAWASDATLVEEVLVQAGLNKEDLLLISPFADAVKFYLQMLQQPGAIVTLNHLLAKEHLAIEFQD